MNEHTQEAQDTEQASIVIENKTGEKITVIPTPPSVRLPFPTKENTSE